MDDQEPDIVFSIFFRINDQEPHEVKGLDTETYHKLKTCDHAAYNRIKTLILSKEMTNDDGNTQTFFHSIDGVQFSQIEIRNTEDGVIEDRDDIALIIEECKKHAFSDGKYFEIDVEKSSFRGTLVGICKLCIIHKTIKGSFKSPSNFATHIKRIHADHYQAFLDYRKTLFEQQDDRVRECHRVTSEFLQRSFEMNVTNYILESMAPFSTVEMPSFRNMFDECLISCRKDGTIDEIQQAIGAWLNYAGDRIRYKKTTGSVKLLIPHCD